MRRMIAVLVGALVIGLAGAAWAQSRFEDVPEDHPQREAIEWAAEQGLLPADSGSFSPGKGVTRADLATVLYAMDSGFDPEVVFLKETYPVRSNTQVFVFEMLSHCHDLDLEVQILTGDGRMTGARERYGILEDGPYSPGDLIEVEVWTHGVDPSQGVGIEWSGSCEFKFGRRILPENEG